MNSAADPSGGPAPPAGPRLFGRKRGHALRARQLCLLDQTLPRLRADPARLPPGPLWLEIGFGGGEHAEAQAAAHPQATLIACDVFAPGICSLLGRLVPHGQEATAPLPPNLRLWTEDARLLMAALPDRSLARAFLLFPDPWPKARHAPRRFVGADNIAALARLLVPGGEWRIATDDPTYQDWVTAELAAQSAFSAPPPATSRPAGWPPTRFEAKALRAGRTPRYWSLTRLD